MIGQERPPGGTHNVFSGVNVGYLIQARDIGDIHIHPVVESTSPLDQAHQRLALLVRARWLAEVAVLGVDEPAPLAVEWPARARHQTDGWILLCNVDGTAAGPELDNALTRFAGARWRHDTTVSDN